MSENVLTLPAITTRLVRGRAAVDALMIVGASALIAIAAQIAIPLPFTPVPLTLQPLAVLFVGVVLGAGRGAAAATLYLLEGMAGLPVFSLGHGGAAWLFFGPTAGYLLSYPAAAFVAGWFSQHQWGSTVLRSIAAMLIALAVIYIGGWSWLAVSVVRQAGEIVVTTNPRAAFFAGVAPFILADVVKIALGAALLPYGQRLVNRSTGI